jgi:hypothetical protein
VCSDYVSTTAVEFGVGQGLPLTSPPAWTNFAINITGFDYSAANIPPGQGIGGYFGGVIGAFGFTLADQTLPSP